jgi:hypothetical protein
MVGYASASDGKRSALVKEGIPAKIANHRAGLIRRSVGDEAAV